MGRCCCSGVDTGGKACVEWWPSLVFPLPCCSEPIDMDTDVLGRLDEGKKGKGRWKRMRTRGSKKIIDEMIQRETERGGGRRLRSGWMNQGCEIRANGQKKKPVASFAGTSVDIKERERDRLNMWEGKRRGETNRKHPTMWNHRLINFKPLMSGALPGQAACIKSVTPSLSAGAAIHCNSHFPISAKDWVAEEQWTHHTTSFPSQLFLLFVLALALWMCD